MFSNAFEYCSDACNACSACSACSALTVTCPDLHFLSIRLDTRANYFIRPLSGLSSASHTLLTKHLLSYFHCGNWSSHRSYPRPSSTPPQRRSSVCEPSGSSELEDSRRRFLKNALESFRIPFFVTTRAGLIEFWISFEPKERICS